MFKIKNLPDGQRQLMSSKGEPLTLPMDAGSAISLWRTLHRRMAEKINVRVISPLPLMREPPPSLPPLPPSWEFSSSRRRAKRRRKS